MNLIHGVEIKELDYRCDERGRLIEILRNDEAMFNGFGQVYLTTVYPGVVKAWHYHKLQEDHFFVVKGMLKLVLYDDRPDSETKGMVNEIFMGEYKTILVKIPPMVYHGFKGIGIGETLVLNIPTKAYNHQQPDEYRIDPHENHIPYQWERKDG
ncbi:polysaccharide biosynthesis C-terminal domain-containing protein [Alkaliphilus crotonatoxidans]